MFALATINGAEHDDMVEPYGRINQAYGVIKSHVDTINRDRKQGERVFMGTTNSREITIHKEGQENAPFLKVNMVEFQPM